VNTSTPNALPIDAAPEVFLAPQAEGPITGRIWGLDIQYECVPIHRLDQFTILNRRFSRGNSNYVSSEAYSQGDIAYFYTLPDGASISVLSQLNGPTNIIGFAEVGLSTGFGRLLEGSASWGYNRSCVFCGNTETNTSVPTYAGLDEKDILEMALWQTYSNPPGSTGNFVGIQNDIPELRNEHTQPNSPYKGYPWDGDMKAVGVRCTSSSATGTAKINGFAGTFTNFQRQDPYSDGNIPPNPPRLGTGVPLMFLQTAQDENFLNYGYLNTSSFRRLANYSTNYTVVNFGYDWLRPLIHASGLELDLNATAQQLDYYFNLVQTSDLQQAVTLAYRQYATQLMFQGASGLSQKWVSNEAIAAVPWSFIRPADPGVPPVFILVTMVLWAVGCAGLSIVYGFQKRWSQTFDDRFVFELIRNATNADLTPRSMDSLIMKEGYQATSNS